MNNPIPSVDVWQSKNDPALLLVIHKGALFCRHPRGLFYSGNVSVGSIESYSMADFSQRGFEIIKESLSTFQNRTQGDACLRSEIDQMSLEQKRRFFEAHRMVGIGPEAGVLRLDPIAHEQPGLKGGSRPASYVSPDASPAEFMCTLITCFAQAD